MQSPMKQKIKIKQDVISVTKENYSNAEIVLLEHKSTPAHWR